MRRRDVVGGLLMLTACGPTLPDPVLVGEALPPGLLSVRAVAADDVWVVGASPDPDDGSGPALLHFQGTAWERLDTQAWPGAELWWVHVDGGELVLVGSQGLILEGSVGGELASVPGPSADVTFFGVWGADASDLWAVGMRQADETGPALWRRQDGTWSEVDASVTEGATLFKVHGQAADDVWFVGSAGTTLHWDGTALVRVPTAEATAPLLTVDTAGGRPVAVGGFGNGLILEHDGGGWVDVSPAFQPGYNGVCSGPDRRWAVGQRGAMALRGEDGVWQTEADLDLPGLILDDWHGCDVDPDGGLWMVGGRIGSRPLRMGVVGYLGDAQVPDVSW